MNMRTILGVVLLSLFSGCSMTQTVTQYRDPKTGIIVEECLRDPQGWGGIFADVSKGNEFAACKTRAEGLGLEKVGKE